MITDAYGYNWEWCEECNCAFIRCDKCDNNCCNGMSKDLPDGSHCGCLKAYEHQAFCAGRMLTPSKQLFAVTTHTAGEIDVSSLNEEEAEVVDD